MDLTDERDPSSQTHPSEEPCILIDSNDNSNNNDGNGEHPTTTDPKPLPKSSPSPPQSRPVNTSKSYMSHKQRRNLTCRAAIMNSDEVNAALSSQEVMENKLRQKLPPRPPQTAIRKQPPKLPPRSRNTVAQNGSNNLSSSAPTIPKRQTVQQQSLSLKSNPVQKPLPTPSVSTGPKPGRASPVMKKRLSLNASSENRPKLYGSYQKESSVNVNSAASTSCGGTWNVTPSTTSARPRFELSAARNTKMLGSSAPTSMITLGSSPLSTPSTLPSSLTSSPSLSTLPTPNEEQNLTSFQQSSLHSLKQLSKMPTVSLERSLAIEVNVNMFYLVS